MPAPVQGHIGVCLFVITYMFLYSSDLSYYALLSPSVVQTLPTSPSRSKGGRCDAVSCRIGLELPPTTGSARDLHHAAVILAGSERPAAHPAGQEVTPDPVLNQRRCTGACSDVPESDGDVV